ncbi:MAG: translocation/assembly module TamB domain-containing protein [Albidovulum sp.]|uniref:translocation/assembly module TamB domain-containing protein n=1 Tax=Albidovulum sp. TaxID=1872424 RepID=UPI003CBB46D9
MRRFWFALCLCLLPVLALAQETSNEDRDFLTGLLEDNLSGAGRDVRITGFVGALSSRATFAEMTIADSEGIWLTLRDGTISWNRRALISGSIEIEEMTAGEILLPRKPATEGPAAEAKGFSLPDLPVAVKIGTLRADRVVLGEALFGAAAEVSLTGTAQLSGGEGSADFSIERIDGRKGTLSLTGSYANASRKATLDLLVAEGKDGIAANLIGLPGTPSIELAVHGSGVIDDFKTDISLTTDGVARLSGAVTLLSVEDDNGKVERSFAANIGGDIAPLLLPEYQEFFGPDITLEAEGSKLPSGQLDLTRLVLGSRGLDLTGSLSLAPDGLPIRTALTIRVGLADGSEVLLPIPGEQTLLTRADLMFRYAAARGDGWKLEGTVKNLHRPDISIAWLSLDGSGRIGRPSHDGVVAARIGGNVRFAAEGLTPTDPALAEALGQTLSGRAVFHWLKGTPLRIPVLEVTGDGYGASGGLNIASTETGPDLSGRVLAEIEDMARFSALAKRPVGGAARLDLSGSAGLLSGIFDAEGSIEGQDLSIGQAELDRLLSGTSRILASVRRDTEGIEIRTLDLVASTLSAQAQGVLRTGASDLTATLDFSDLAVLGPKYRGSLAAEARLTETGDTRRITLEGRGGNLGIGQASVDQLLAGSSEISLAAEQTGDRVRLEALRIANPQLSLDAEGVSEGEIRHIDLSARLNNMALLAPGFPGPLTAEGRITEEGTRYLVDLGVTGPGATTARIDGSIAQDFKTADLAIDGGAQSAILNPFIAPRNVEGPVSFDLRLSGPPRLASLSGRVGINGGRLVAPTFGIELQDLIVSADLANSRATVSGGANVRGGGRIEVSGPVALTPPFEGDLALRLNAVKLRDPDLYDTTVDGSVAIRGAFRGGARIEGAVALGRTEISIPSTGFGTTSVVDGIAHVNEPAGVRRTRARAGLIKDDDAGKKGGPVYGLDLTISAPERIFVRGRGLDAEMGGSLKVGGTTANIVPSGQFTLIRGRLDILGKRFTMDEGLVQLQGALTPYVRFSASSQSDTITATIVIEGEASEPEIRFLSSPELPEEEVIAHLLFGRSLTSLSPFQAAQLASAVATLAGKGGEGIVSKLRNSFGLDDLDVTTDENGTAALRAGKYISEKVYTDVTIGGEGKTELNLNLDVRPGVTLRGKLESDGGTGVGLFYEKDY